METTDIFIEASKGPALPVVALPMKYCGSTTRNWLSSPVRFWSVRHRGVHQSSGLYTIAQAFSGYLIQNGDVDQPCLPSRIPPITFLA